MTKFIDETTLIGSTVGFPAVKTILHGGQASRNAGGVKQNLIAVEICAFIAFALGGTMYM